MNAGLTCRELLGDISEYVDGAACEELERHLAECGNCRIVVNTLMKTVELYQQAPANVVSERVKERLFLRLNLANFAFPAPFAVEVGELCPNCAQAELEYDEMLNLTCGSCGWTQAGCST